jgi:hypothetical protein
MLFLFDICIANALSLNKGFVSSKTKTQFLDGYCDDIFDTMTLRQRVPHTMPARNAYSNLAVGATKTMAEVEMFDGHVLMSPQLLKKAEACLHGNACATTKRARVRSQE